MMAKAKSQRGSSREELSSAQSVHDIGEAGATGSSVPGTSLRYPLIQMKNIPKGMIAICAEPGTGKTWLASRLLQQAQDRNEQTALYNFERMSGEQAARRIVRVCRETAKKWRDDKPGLIVFDGIAPGDESEVASETRALERLQAHGYDIVLCLRPESEQLIEGLHDCLCLRSEELLYRKGTSDSEWDLTGGIPALVTALGADSRLHESEMPGLKYVSALELLMTQTLRDGLPHEEFCNRLAMMVLGSGTLDELALVSGRCDAEQFAWLARDLNLCEIDVREGTFVCHGLSSDDLYAQCLECLQAPAAGEVKLVVRACGVLASRGDVHRSALTCALCASSAEYAKVGTAWGALFVSAGELRLVEQSLKVIKQLDMPVNARVQLSSLAFLSVGGTVQQVDQAREMATALPLVTQMELRMRQTGMLLADCRNLWRSPRLAFARADSTSEEAADMLYIEHLRVSHLLVRGSFAEAYAFMTSEVTLSDVTCLGEALLCDDLSLALVLSGGTPDRRERYLFERAERFYARTNQGRLQSYHRALVEMPALLMGRQRDAFSLEDAMARADRAGDVFLQALFMAGMAVSDLRESALSRAHVRAEKAATAARLLGEEYLASAAELIDALTLELLGERGVLARWCERTDRPRGLLLIGQLAAHEMGELEKDMEPLSALSGAACPRNELWLLGVLSSACRSLSDSVNASMPSSWLATLRMVQERQVALMDGTMSPAVGAKAHKGGLREGQQEQLLPELVTSSRSRVRISVLGGFHVEVDGVSVPQERFDRRRSRDLVTLLSVVPGHRLRRFQVVEILWPGVDYYRGPRKLYEATSEIRKLLASYLSGQNVVIADRMQGTVGLDSAVVSCDIDDFEREARLALAEDGDDFWVLDHARQMERLYADGPDPIVVELGDRIIERLDELRELYVDGAVAASEAALRLGKAKLAVRFASDAQRLNDLREDVMIVYVQALRAAGRGFEVAALYRRYAQRLFEEQGASPSVTLRRVVERVMGEGGELRPA